MDLGPKLGDAASLWNFTPSPGAAPKTRASVGGKPCSAPVLTCAPRRRSPARRLVQGGSGSAEAGAWQVRHRALGADRRLWRASGQAHPAAQRADAAAARPAVASRCAVRRAQRVAGVAPRTRAQLTRTFPPRTPAFTGLRIDVDAVRKDNEAKQGDEVVRKSGLIINSGGACFGRVAVTLAYSDCLRSPGRLLPPGTTDKATMEQLRRENEKKCAHRRGCLYVGCKTLTQLLCSGMVCRRSTWTPSCSRRPFARRRPRRSSGRCRLAATGPRASRPRRR